MGMINTELCECNYIQCCVSFQVEEVAEAFKENLDTNKPNTRFCFLNQNDEGKTMINFMNPDSGESKLTVCRSVHHSMCIHWCVCVFAIA